MKFDRGTKLLEPSIGSEEEDFQDALSEWDEQLCDDKRVAEYVGSEEVGSVSDVLVPSWGWDYEVFLSFRGPDTRTGFADFLYEALTGAGVRTYRDEEELRKGEEIGPELIKAIQQTRVSIPIFSKNYASSKWCLSEVAEMMKCGEKQSILPVFYYVQPRDVRHQQGSFEEAFREHETKFCENIIQDWRNALRNVGALKGWTVDENQGEGFIVRKVVQRVEQLLKKDRLQVPDYLVGISEHVEKILNLLNVAKSEDVKILGIYGMGGIGKTTLAKVLYNHLSDKYETCCFISDVRETSLHHKGLESLQKQFISKINKTECRDISNVDEGLSMIKGRFCNKKVLIFLDDVEHKNQLDALAIKPNSFGGGSRIIVTTRNKHVFNGFQESVLIDYECKGLDFQQSLRLFSKHAFYANCPPEEFLALSREIVSTSAGLPLTLEVVGSLLYDKSKEMWSDTVEKLKYTSHNQVQEKLKISYDALDYEQKQIFLDIACLFNGMDKTLPFYMWRDCNFFPDNGIDSLCSKSLLKVENGNILSMHDQLRDLGRAIIREENYKEPGERSRLWCSEEAIDVLERKAGTNNVEALSLELPDSKMYSFTNAEFRTLGNLRFLHVKGANFIGEFNLPKLRWFHWQVINWSEVSFILGHRSPSGVISANFHVKNLVILNLSWSQVTKDWKGWSQIQMSKKLKVLDLSYCLDLVRIPDISALANLERLILQGCDRLVEIDPSIKKLKSLVFLDLRKCMILRTIPTDLGSMENLEELLIDSTKLARIPLAVSMKKLKVLRARDCKSLTEVPSSIGNLTSVIEITFDASGIIKLPDSIGSLDNLQILSLARCMSLMELPESIGRLKSLSELHLGSLKITELPDSIGNIKTLRVLNVSSASVKKLPTSIGMLEKLEEMNICHCNCLEGDIPFDISRLTSLKILHFSDTSARSLPAGVSRLSCLEVLDTSGSNQLQSLPVLPSSLRELRITCQSQETVPNLAHLTNLKKLAFAYCSRMVEILGSFEKLAKLNTLSFYSTNIRTLPENTWALPQLEYLHFQKCSVLGCLPVLPSSLREIRLVSCESLATLPDISNLKNLSHLFLDCEKLVSVDGLGELEFLVHLYISSTSLDRLPNLSKLKKVTNFEIPQCEKLVEIQGIEGLESLHYLDASGCKNLCKLDGLEQLINLEWLNICGCKSISKMPTLSSNTKQVKKATKYTDDDTVEESPRSHSRLCAIQ